MPKWVKSFEIISGPHPAPALSSGSILKERILVPGSVDELTPSFHLKLALFPVDPYLKYLEVESLKFSKKELWLLSSCALAIKPPESKTANKIYLFHV